MDVPFHSSGAASRAHYAIVRKVESSPSIQMADQHIALEIKSIQAQIYDPKLSIVSHLSWFCRHSRLMSY